MYPDNYPACIMCGAAPGDACVYISSAHDEHYNQTAGEPRPAPHAYRAKPGQESPVPGFVAVKDEPDHWGDQCTDPACKFHSGG